jgi:hypothetical protein
MKKNNSWALRVVAWTGKAALFCLGLLAMLALIVLVAVLSPVMLAATVIPRARRGRDEKAETGDTTGTPRSFRRSAELGLPGGGRNAEGEDLEGLGLGSVANLANRGPRR